MAKDSGELLAEDGAVEWWEESVERDIDNVLALFGEFYRGTHGAAGEFSLLSCKRLRRASKTQ